MGAWTVVAWAAAALLLAGALWLYRKALAPGGSTLEQIVDHALRKARRPGSALVVGVLHGGQVWTKGYGAVNPADVPPAAPTGATVFQIGSLSKVMTASLLPLLAGRHGIAEGTTVQEALGPAAAPVHPAHAGITLAALATHTTGLPRVPKFLERDLPVHLGVQEVLKNPYSLIQPATVWDYLQQPPDRNDGKPMPGRFAYSNYGMGLLGHLLERRTGQPYGALLAREIFAPLGMQDSAVEPAAALRERLAQGHTARGEPCAPWSFVALHGAGAVFSTADDLLRFARAQLDAAMPLHAALAATHVPRAGGATGLGWMQPTLVDRLLGNRHIVWHDGATLGYCSYLSIDLQAGLALVILGAQGNGVTVPGMLLTRKLRKFMASQPPSQAQPPSHQEGATA